ncbi:MAG: hypothetical protein GY797_38790 [Deltaproteobacteria bacterium]|nr:hypothetical protein [Deltaproteobacteria bacterium]
MPTSKETTCCDECEDGIYQAICYSCAGSGEGQYDGSTCAICKGSGRQEQEYCNCERGDERLSEEIF